MARQAPRIVRRYSNPRRPLEDDPGGGAGDEPQWDEKPVKPTAKAAPEPRSPEPIIDPRTGKSRGVRYPTEKVVMSPRMNYLGEPILDANGQVRLFPTVTEEWDVDYDPAPRQGRDPSAVRVDQAQADRIRQQIEMEPSRFALDEDVQRGRLGLSREELDMQREFGAIDRAMKQAQFAYDKARSERNDAEAVRQFNLMQALREKQTELEGGELQLKRDLGEAKSRVDALGANIDRNKQFGYVVDAEGTGLAAGTLTADESQRRFQNVRSVQDAIQARGERTLDRQRQDAQATRQAGFQQQQMQMQRDQMGEQGRQFDVGTQTQWAARQRPRVFTPSGPVISRRGI